MVYLSEWGPTRVCTKTGCPQSLLKLGTHLRYGSRFRLSFDSHPVRPPVMAEPELPQSTSVDSLPIASLPKNPSEVKGSTFQDALDKESRPEGAASEANEKAELDNEDNEVSGRCCSLICLSMTLIILAIIRSRRC